MVIKHFLIFLIFLPMLLNVHLVEAAQLELYMADPEVRIAQKIYCQIRGAESTDRLQAFLDGRLIFEKAGDLQAEEAFVADYRTLKAGTHQLVVKVLDPYHQEKASAAKTWTTLHDGIPTVGIDENNAIRVNGELFFPIYALLNEEDFSYWIDQRYVNAGSGMYYRDSYTLDTYADWLNICVGKGVRNVGPTTRWDGFSGGRGKDSDLDKMSAYVETFRDHAGVLMWQWADEPDGGGGVVAPAEIRSWTEVSHRYDTNHPHAVNLVAYNWSKDENWFIEHCRKYSYLYGADQHGGEKKLIADIIGFDYYPIEYATQKDGIYNFESLAKALDRIREYNYDLTPIFSWNENCDIHADADGDGYADGPQPAYLWTPAPTPEEMWAEYWIKVIHGVKGFKLHPYFASDCRAAPPRNHETMLKFSQWMDELKGAILGPEYSGAAIEKQEMKGGRVDLLVKEHEGYLYIFAANLKRESEMVRFITADLIQGASIEVYGEGRVIPSQDGSFEDEFAPLAVHVYRLVKAEETPIFEDVPFSHWANGYIEELYRKGYIEGCSSSPRRYCPELNLNRAEAAVFVVRGLHPDVPGYIPPAPTAQYFDDVLISPGAEWFAKWVTELKERGYTEGCSKDPPLYCSLLGHRRAEATVFFWRMLNGPDAEPPETTEQIFNDVPPTDEYGNPIWYHRWVNAAYQAGIIQACQTDMVNILFRPEEDLTRDEAACMMFMALGLSTP